MGPGGSNPSPTAKIIPENRPSARAEGLFLLCLDRSNQPGSAPRVGKMCPSRRILWRTYGERVANGKTPASDLVSASADEMPERQG